MPPSSLNAQHFWAARQVHRAEAPPIAPEEVPRQQCRSWKWKCAYKLTIEMQLVVQENMRCTSAASTSQIYTVNSWYFLPPWIIEISQLSWRRNTSFTMCHYPYPVETPSFCSPVALSQSVRPMHLPLLYNLSIIWYICVWLYQD